MAGSKAKKGNGIQVKELSGINEVLSELNLKIVEANAKIEDFKSQFETSQGNLVVAQNELQTAKLGLEGVIGSEDKRLIDFFNIVRRIEWGSTSYEDAKGKSPKGRLVADCTSNLYIPVVNPEQSVGNIADIHIYVATAIVVEPEVFLEGGKYVARIKPLLTQEELDREVGNASIWAEETPKGHIYYLVAALDVGQYSNLKEAKLLQGSASRRFDLKRAGKLPKSEAYGSQIPPPSNGRDDDTLASRSLPEDLTRD